MMSAEQIYLDNNATSRLAPRVAQRMVELSCEGIANPSSQHRSGRQALRILEESKASVLQSVGASNEGMDGANVILTSGGTEANNLVLHCYTYQQEGLVIVGAMEHPSILQAAELSAICLNPVRLLPALSSGRYDLNCLADWLEAIYTGRDEYKRVAFVSLMLANNETGVLNDLSEVVRLCSRYDIPVHSDIVQAVGKVDFDMESSGVSAVTLAVHKVHGPVGIGALILKPDVTVRPMIVGGGQQMGWRAGTEPVVLAAGMAESLKLAAQARIEGVYHRVAQLRDRFEERLAEELDGVWINGDTTHRVPQTSNLSFEGIDRQAMQMSLDLAGVACSAGSACASGSSRPSVSLLAMGLNEQRTGGALRFSLSRFTSESEIDGAVATVRNIVGKLRCKKLKEDRLR